MTEPTEDHENEDWRYVPNYPEWVVSNFGQIRRTGYAAGRPLKLEADPTKDGAIFVTFFRSTAEERRHRLDRIVAAAHLKSTIHNLMHDEVVHLDGDQNNCRADNLAWKERD